MFIGEQTMIALLSDGITSKPLKKALSGYFITLSIAAVVITADNKYKRRYYSGCHFFGDKSDKRGNNRSEEKKDYGYI